MTHVPVMAQESTDNTRTDKGYSNDVASAPSHNATQELDIQKSYDEFNPLLIGDRKPVRARWARILIANLTGNIRGVHHGVSEKHLHRYLAEFLYRFNRRAWSSQLLNRALTACATVSTVTYAELNI